ncbi:hypothetical protein HDU96_004773 [Phlyctochytrium bullatum]|nr:hypothetical protein HDU96_004773 [Phlyctochytrium bullatum]
MTDGNDIPVTGTFNEIEFDREKMCKYFCCCNACLCIATGFCFPAAFCSCCHAQALAKRFKASMDETKLLVQGGYFDTSEKLTPLDRIQDVQIDQGILGRCLGTSNISIQTAANRPGKPEVILYTPKDPVATRNLIMAKRDQLVLGSRAAHGKQPQMAATVKTIVNTRPAAEMLEQAKELKQVIDGIEAEVKRGVETYKKSIAAESA